jgi:sulfur carrier protein ThiS
MSYFLQEIYWHGRQQSRLILPSTGAFMINHHKYVPSMLNHRLSVLTDYYVRKLIRRYRGRLKSVVAHGACIEADTQTSIDDVLESLYLEPEAIAAQVKELEVMIRHHQHLEQKVAQKPSLAHSQLQNLERQIFWVIGFKVQETGVNNLVEMVSVRPHLRQPTAA